MPKLSHRQFINDAERYRQWTQNLRSRKYNKATLKQQLDTFTKIAGQLPAIPPTRSQMTHRPYAEFWPLWPKVHTAWLNRLAWDLEHLNELQSLLNRQTMLQTFLALPLDTQTVESCAQALIGKCEEAVARFRMGRQHVVDQATTDFADYAEQTHFTPTTLLALAHEVDVLQDWHVRLRKLPPKSELIDPLSRKHLATQWRAFATSRMLALLEHGVEMLSRATPAETIDLLKESKKHNFAQVPSLISALFDPRLASVWDRFQTALQSVQQIAAQRLWLEVGTELANTLARLPDAVDYKAWQALYNQIRNLIHIWPPSSPVRLSLADCYSKTAPIVFRWFNDGCQSFAEALMQRLCVLDSRGTYLDRAMQRSFTPQSWDLLAAEHLRTRLHFPAKHRLLHRPATHGDSGTSGLPTQSGFAAWIAHVQQHSVHLTLAQRIQLLELTERATQNIITSPARFPDGWYTAITEEPFRSWGWQLISIGPADYQWGRVRIDSEHGSFVFTMGAKTVNDTLSDAALLAVTWLLAWFDGAGQSPTFGSNRRSGRRTHSFQPSSPTRDRFAPTPLKRVLGRSFSRPTRSDPTGRAVVSHPVCSYFRWVRSDFVASPQRQALATAASVTIPPGYTFVPASWSPRMDQHIESQPVPITPQWTRHTTMYAWRVAVAQW